MRKILNLVLVTASAAMLSLMSGCVPGDTDSSGSGLTYEPGAPCDPDDVGEWFECRDGGRQLCDPTTGTAGECTDNTPCSPPSGLMEAPSGGGSCASNQFRFCNVDGSDADSDPGDGAAGYQTCDTMGNWQDCGACGDVVPQSDPPDAGPPAPCGGDPLIGTTCATGVGGCADDGMWVCRDSMRVCEAMPGMSMTEICDGIDNDCDGSIDDGVVRSCYTGPAGTLRVGLCREGYQMCTDGVWDTACSGEVTPVAETCDGMLHDNGLDEDCSGSDLECLDCGGDLSPGASCATGLGACAGTGTYVCNAMNEVECDAVVGTGDPETCDGVDNDCDGTVDDDPEDGSLPWVDDTCYTDSSGATLGGNPDLGVCSRGSRTCTSGAWTACAGAVGPSAEICDNGLDDDCDGHTDARDVVDCPGGGSGTDAGVPMTDAGSSVMDAGAPMADAGSGSGSDSGSSGSDSGLTGAAADREVCRDDRVSDGFIGTHEVTYDLACIASTFGTCAAGWQVGIYDHKGCFVPGDPGADSVAIDLSRDSEGYYRTGLQCVTSRSTWPGPEGTAASAQCVTSFLVNGLERLSTGRICNGAGGLLPTLQSSPTGPDISCP